MVLSAISAICACISANSALSRADLSSPSIIFKIAPDVGDTFLCFSFWYVIWTRQREISTYFSLLSLHTHNKWRLVEFGNGNGEHQGKNYTNWRSRKFPLTTVIILMVLLIVGFDMLKTCSRLRSRSPSVEFYRSLMGANFQDLRNGLMLDNRSDKVLEEMELYEIIISSVYMIFTIYCKLVKAFALLLCSAGVLVVYSNSCDFKEYLLKEIDQLKVMHAFQAFQDFIESVNQVTGPIVFSIAIVCAPTFFVANLGSLLIVWNLDSPITWLTYIIYIVIFLPAAEVTNQVPVYLFTSFTCLERKKRFFIENVILFCRPTSSENGSWNVVRGNMRMTSLRYLLISHRILWALKGRIVLH